MIFSLKNADSKIISLYGRSITDDKDLRHFYLINREGLYPHCPKSGTTRLILTERIIDAVSLLQQPEITSRYEILALYGTNGLTEEHLQAIIGLKDLQEIILMLNADARGEAAAVKHCSTLKTLLPDVTISKVTMPAGEDVNSVLYTHDDAKVLADLIEQRTPTFPEATVGREFFALSEAEGSIENKNQSSSETLSAPGLQPLTKLDARNPELLVYDNCELHIDILGGIKITGFDRMKVMLKVQYKQRQLLPIRDTLDLYSRGQTEQLIQTISENFDVGIRQTETTISELTGELENYRINRIEALQPKPEQQPEMTSARSFSFLFFFQLKIKKSILETVRVV